MTNALTLDLWNSILPLAGLSALVSWLPGGQRFSVMRFIVANGVITGIDVMTDRARLDQLEFGDLVPE